MLFGWLLVIAGTTALLMAVYGTLTQPQRGRHHRKESEP